MNRTGRVLTVAWVVAGVFALSGCDSSPKATTVPECGNIHLPDDARIVHQTGDQEFSGEAHVEVVAEFPAARFADFTTASQLGEFTTGVPNNWRKHYWQDSGMADSLNAETNENYSDWDGTTGRQIVVHRLDADTVRVFTRGWC